MIDNIDIRYDSIAQLAARLDVMSENKIMGYEFSVLKSAASRLRELAVEGPKAVTEEISATPAAPESAVPFMVNGLKELLKEVDNSLINESRVATLEEEVKNAVLDGERFRRERDDARLRLNDATDKLDRLSVSTRVELQAEVERLKTYIEGQKLAIELNRKNYDDSIRYLKREIEVTRSRPFSDESELAMTRRLLANAEKERDSAKQAYAEFGERIKTAERERDDAKRIARQAQERSAKNQRDREHADALTREAQKEADEANKRAVAAVEDTMKFIDQHVKLQLDYDRNSENQAWNQIIEYFDSIGLDMDVPGSTTESRLDRILICLKRHFGEPRKPHESYEKPRGMWGLTVRVMNWLNNHA